MSMTEAANDDAKPISPTDHPPGVYFGLDEDAYHNDVALGSTDMKRLATSPPQFWFESRYNAAWEPWDEKPATVLGSARHKFVLEGKDAFLACYAPQTIPANTKAGKDEVEAIRASGRKPIKVDEFNRIMQIGTIVRSNPSIANAFSGGAGSEVSIFWVEDGIKRKCRIDYVKPRASVDLKSVANQFDKHFPSACREAIAKYRYDIQAYHYAMGRRAAKDLFKAGAVFGEFDEEAFAKCMHGQPVAWVWICYQSAGAPLTWGCQLSPDNPIMEAAGAAIETAENNWREYLERFGLDTAWVHDEPMRELSIDEMPGWYGRD